MCVNRNIILLCLKNILSTMSINIQGWNYINLHCRDNDNSPVDWWYIYKPPSEIIPFYELGRNFTFITPDSLGRWEMSDKYITTNSMLQNTLAPIFRSTYRDHLAVAIYDHRKGDRKFAGSVARGVLMVDGLGGVWIYHTVPDLVNMWNDRLFFPEKDSSNGHLIMCLSLDLDTANAVVHTLRNLYPKVTYLKIPEKLQHLLPEWNLLEVPLRRTKSRPKRFVSRGNTLKVEYLVQRPGDKHSVYQTFASNKNIVLDVYGQSDNENISSICSKEYSVRNIESISIKFPESVIYVTNMTDRMKFAVSTAAHWQTLGTGPKQYWACISNLDKDDLSGAGGDMVCVENYRVWRTFDNLKIKEPSCTE